MRGDASSASSGFDCGRGIGEGSDDDAPSAKKGGAWAAGRGGARFTATPAALIDAQPLSGSSGGPPPPSHHHVLLPRGVVAAASASSGMGGLAPLSASLPMPGGAT
jgi:hypothetical protein